MNEFRMKTACIATLFVWLLYVPGNLAGNKWRNYMAGPMTDVGKTCKVETRAFVMSALSSAACAYRCNTHSNCMTIFYSPSTKICHGCHAEFGNLESDREQLPGSLPYTVCDHESGWIPYMGNCYFFGTEPMEYDTAWDFCVSNGSQIVYIESSDEIAFLKEQMEKTCKDYWNALYQYTVDGNEKWMMMDGNMLEPAVLNWFSFEPNRHYQRCTFMQYGQQNYQWVDVGCTDAYRPVCKKTG